MKPAVTKAPPTTTPMVTRSSDRARQCAAMASDATSVLVRCLNTRMMGAPQSSSVPAALSDVGQTTNMIATVRPTSKRIRLANLITSDRTCDWPHTSTIPIQPWDEYNVTTEHGRPTDGSAVRNRPSANPNPPFHRNLVNYDHTRVPPRLAQDRCEVD